MANTRAIRRRIKSVKNTAQITKAMQMVAASKMRRAQQAAVAGRPYAEQMNKILLSLDQPEEEMLSPFLARREDKMPGVLVISTDKGLCGPLNTNVFREVMKFSANAKFVTIGRKAKQFVVRAKCNLVADFIVRENPGIIHTKPVSQLLMDLYLKREIDSIHVIYPRFVNTLVQETRTAQVLPIKGLVGLKTTKFSEDGKAKERVNYLFEPGPGAVLDKLLPAYINFEVYQMILDARASEHSARMVAMKSATDNAKALVKDLTLEYNKARQADITNQILEISTAQMAMS